MTFELDATHRAIRDTARSFAREQVAPRAKAWDEARQLPERDRAQARASSGFLGINIPEHYGGAGLDTLAYAISVEEIARADGSLAPHRRLAQRARHGAHPRFGSEEQKQRYLPKLASGEWLRRWALTEPGSG